MGSKRLDMFDAMIAKGATDPFVFYARAMELRSLGDHVAALIAFEDVSRRFSDYVPTYLMAGQVASQANDHEAARRWYERGILVAAKVGDAHALSELRQALAVP